MEKGIEDEMKGHILKRLGIVILVLLLIVLLHTSWFEQLINLNQEDLLTLKEEMGYQVLLFTIPLGILQGVLSLFPFLTIVVIHTACFGFLEGLFFSWLSSCLGSLVCFFLARHFVQDWAHNMWEKNREKYTRFFRYVNRYGFWGLIFLRSFSFLPSNVISILAALSPLSFKVYFWATLVGHVPMVLLLTLLSSPLA